MERLLLEEYNPLNMSSLENTNRYLTEEEIRGVKENNEFYVVSVVQIADTLNANNRIYPRFVLEREINAYNRLISEKRTLGENNHSDSDQVDVNNVSHGVVGLWWEGNNVMAKIKILDTTAGENVRKILKNGFSLGISSRALGSLRESGGHYVVEDDLSIICWDIVTQPSTPGAFLKKIHESKNIKEQIPRSVYISSLIKDIVGGK
jgi:hypothetical protein